MKLSQVHAEKSIEYFKFIKKIKKSKSTRKVVMKKDYVDVENNFIILISSPQKDVVWIFFGS